MEDHTRDSLVSIVPKALGSRLSRRDMIKRASITAFAAPALVSLLAACADDDDVADDAAPAVDPDDDDDDTVAPDTDDDDEPVDQDDDETVADEGDIERGFMRAPEGEVRRGGIVRWSGHISLAHFDIHQGASSWSMGHLYNTLVRRNLVDGLQTIIPDLAESWDLSDDATVYTFHIREGVEFHNGASLDAEDVEATFNRITDPPSGITSTLRDLFSGVSDIEVTDEYTIVFTLSQPQPWALELFSNPSAVVYSRPYLEENDYDLRNAIPPGTGAFMNVEFREGEQWEMERNPNYWDPELPYVDGMVLLHLPEWSDRGVAILTGQADVTLNTSVEMFEEAQQHDNITAMQQPSTGIYKLLFNCQNEPFDDPLVRRAIHLAIRRQDLIAAFGSFEGVKLTRWLPRASDYATAESELEQMPGYRGDKDEDIEQARELLAEAGYPDGFGDVNFLVASVASHAEVLAPAIQDQLSTALNIETNIQVVERALLPEEYMAGNFDISVMGTTMPPVLDPVPHWSVAFRTGGSLNFAHYSNPEFDDLLDELALETEYEDRAPLVERGQEILDENPPWVVVGWVDHNPMWANYVKGVALEQRVISELGRLETIWLDQE